MTVDEAREIVEDFNNNINPSDEDEFMFLEAMDYLIATEENPEDMMYLGGYYYEQKKFDLALKYYEMASSYGYEPADECLGYVWYYGRTGERDYEKAFKYFSRAKDRGNIVAAYKVADMYKNGYFVEKDYEKYKSIIESLYPRIKYARRLGEPLPEIFTRLARIRVEQGRISEAVKLYLYAKDFLAQRLSYNAFFGHLNVMKWMIDELYEIKEFDYDNCDFYDLYYVLKSPANVKLTYRGKTYDIESAMEEGACVVKFNGVWYRDRDDFFKKARIEDERLTDIYDMLSIDVKEG